MRAVVCGAGIAGQALAQRLDAAGWDVVVLEKAPSPRTQGYMIDFFGPGYDATEAMGLLPRVRDVSYRIDEVVYVDDDGRRRAALDYTQFAKAVSGRAMAVLRPDLEEVLRASLSDATEIRFGTSVSAIEQRRPCPGHPRRRRQPRCRSARRRRRDPLDGAGPRVRTRAALPALPRIPHRRVHLRRSRPGCRGVGRALLSH